MELRFSTALARQVLTEGFPAVSFRFAEQPESETNRNAVSAMACGLASLEAQPDDLVAVIPGNAPLLRPVVDNLMNCCPAQPSASSPREPSEYSSRFASHFQIAWQPNQQGASCETDGPILVARIRFLSHQLQDGMVRHQLLDQALQECCQARPDSCLHLASPPHLLAPVNTRGGLIITEAKLKTMLMTQLGEQGVTFRDPPGTFLGPNIQIGQDSIIGVGVQLYGSTKASHRSIG